MSNNIKYLIWIILAVIGSIGAAFLMVMLVKRWLWVEIIIDLEKETADDLKLAISKIQKEIDRRNNVRTDLNAADKPAQQNIKINLTQMLLKNKDRMLKNRL